MTKIVRKSIDGISPLPSANRRSPLIHSANSRRRLDESLRVEAVATSAGGVFGVSSFSRSLQPASVNVEPERFVQSRPLI